MQGNSMEGNTDKGLKLWYREPADITTGWEEALPLGNGRLGGIVFGGIDLERIQLNEDSMWYGGPLDRNNPDALSHLQTIRDLIVKGRIKEAEKLAVLALSGTMIVTWQLGPVGYYQLVNKIGLSNSLWFLILPAIASAGM